MTEPTHAPLTPAAPQPTAPQQVLHRMEADMQALQEQARLRFQALLAELKAVL